MPEQSVVGIYDTRSKAEQAVRQLDREGFSIQQASIIGHDSGRELKVQGYVTVEDMATTVERRSCISTSSRSRARTS
jgi:hypothetical protein